MDTVEQKYKEWFYWNRFTTFDDNKVNEYKKKINTRDKYIYLNRYSHIFDRDYSKALKNLLVDILNTGPIRQNKTLLTKKRRARLNPFLEFILKEFPADKLQFESSRKKKDLELNLDYISTHKKINISQYGNITGIMHDGFKGITDLLTEEIMYFSKNKIINRIGKLKIASDELIYLRRRNMIIQIKHINLLFFLYSHDMEYLKVMALMMYDYMNYFSALNINLHIHVISYPLLQYMLTPEAENLKDRNRAFWEYYTLNNNKGIKEYFTTDNEGDYKAADFTGNLVRNILLSRFTYLFSYMPVLGFNTYLSDWLTNRLLNDLQQIFNIRLKDSTILQQGGDSYCVNQFIYFLPALENQMDRRYYINFHKEFNFGVLNYFREDLFPLQQTGSCFMVEKYNDAFNIYNQEYADQTALRNKNRKELRNICLKSIIKIFEPGVE